jgi:hypothetical protein
MVPKSKSTTRRIKKHFVLLGLMLGLVMVTVAVVVAWLGVVGFMKVRELERAQTAVDLYRAHIARAQTAAKVNHAKMDMVKLRAAALAFSQKHGELHLPLEKLVKQQPDGAPGLLKESDLIDPWGNRYEGRAFSDGPYFGPHLNPPVTVSIGCKGPPGENEPIFLMVGHKRVRFDE